MGSASGGSSSSRRQNRNKKKCQHESQSQKMRIYCEIKSSFISLYQTMRKSYGGLGGLITIKSKNKQIFQILSTGYIRRHKLHLIGMNFSGMFYVLNAVYILASSVPNIF